MSCVPNVASFSGLSIISASYKTPDVLLTYTTFNLRCLDLLFPTSEDSTISHTTILPLGNHGSIDTLLAAFRILGK
jgi:hypothetical protein